MDVVHQWKGLTEAEEIKKSWQDYTEELYKKHLNGRANHNGMVTHLEPDIFKQEVKHYNEQSLWK